MPTKLSVWTHSYARIPLCIHTERERERECVCVLVATYVCQTRKSDTPADTLKVWRWTEGNKSCVALASVKEMWPSSQPLEPICQGPVTVQSGQELRTKRPPRAACLPQRLKALNHRVEKVPIPLCTHAQSVTRSGFKNTRADSCGPCWPAFMNTASSLQVNGP